MSFMSLIRSPYRNVIVFMFYARFRSRMFDVPKRNKANLTVIFGRTVDKLLQQILENALNDFVNSWLR